MARTRSAKQEVCPSRTNSGYML